MITITAFPVEQDSFKSIKFCLSFKRLFDQTMGCHVCSVLFFVFALSVIHDKECLILCCSINLVFVCKLFIKMYVE